MMCLFCDFNGGVKELKEHYTECKELQEITRLKQLLSKEITEKEYLKDEQTN